MMFEAAEAPKEKLSSITRATDKVKTLFIEELPPAVSLALNNKPGVSRETRKSVISAARECGYNFGHKVISATGKKGTICFAIYKKSGAVVADTPLFAALSEGISKGCSRERYDCVIRYLYEDEKIYNQVVSLSA